MKHCCCWLLLFVMVGLGGCFNRSKARQPEIAADVEESFKQRWIGNRMTELQASGVTDAREARRQASEEFRKKYEYIKSAGSPDRVGGPTP